MGGGQGRAACLGEVGTAGTLTRMPTGKKKNSDRDAGISLEEAAEAAVAAVADSCCGCCCGYRKLLRLLQAAVAVVAGSVCGFSGSYCRCCRLAAAVAAGARLQPDSENHTAALGELDRRAFVPVSESSA